MLALGIDPGTAICGYGFVEQVGSRLVPREYGAITTSPKARMEDRLLKLYDGLDELVKKYEPDVMGVELLSAAKNHLQLAEHTPLQVKQAVTGYGKATKEQVIYMVTKLLHLPKPPKPDDVADALAIAICTTHCMNSVAWRNRMEEKR